MAKIIKRLAKPIRSRLKKRGKKRSSWWIAGLATVIGLVVGLITNGDFRQSVSEFLHKADFGTVPAWVGALSVPAALYVILRDRMKDASEQAASVIVWQTAREETHALGLRQVEVSVQNASDSVITKVVVFDEEFMSKEEPDYRSRFLHLPPHLYWPGNGVVHSKETATVTIPVQNRRMVGSTQLSLFFMDAAGRYWHKDVQTQATHPADKVVPNAWRGARYSDLWERPEVRARELAKQEEDHFLSIVPNYADWIRKHPSRSVGPFMVDFKGWVQAANPRDQWKPEGWSTDT